MLKLKYINRLSKIIRKYFPEKENKAFIFGSSIQCEKFWDIDVGILGEVSHKKLRNLKEELEKSTFPFLVDLVDFNNVEKDFQDSVIFHQEKTWI